MKLKAVWIVLCRFHVDPMSFVFWRVVGVDNLKMFAAASDGLKHRVDFLLAGELIRLFEPRAVTVADKEG